MCKKRLFFVGIVGFALLLSFGELGAQTLKLAVSKTFKEHTYINWIKKTQADAELIDMNKQTDVETALKALQECHALLLTGGEDVCPHAYGMPHENERCYTAPLRDSLENALIRKAEALGIPVLGICRGAQLLNVYYGGSLIVDIPADYKTHIAHRGEKGDARHQVRIFRNTRLFEIVRVDSGEVNSSHHQAAKRIAPGFCPAAQSPDGICEGIAPEVRQDRFVLGVQWHPERLKYANPLSGRIAVAFLAAAREYRKTKASKR